jgi:hypothetical protein
MRSPVFSITIAAGAARSNEFQGANASFIDRNVGIRRDQMLRPARARPPHEKRTLTASRCPKIALNAERQGRRLVVIISLVNHDGPAGDSHVSAFPRKECRMVRMSAP